MDHRLGTEDDLGLLPDAQTPGAPQIRLCKGKSSGSDRVHLKADRMVNVSLTIHHSFLSPSRSNSGGISTY
jgi:hypothetical protein